MLLTVRYIPLFVILICTIIKFCNQRRAPGMKDYRSLLVSVVSMGGYLLVELTPTLSFMGLRFSELSVGFCLIAIGALSGKQLWSLIGAIWFLLHSAAQFITGQAVSLTMCIDATVCLLLTGIAFYQNKVHKEFPLVLWIALFAVSLISENWGINITLLAVVVWFSPKFENKAKMTPCVTEPEITTESAVNVEEKLAALENLQVLLRSGAISEEAFNTKKGQLLGSSSTSVSSAVQQNIGKCVVCGCENVPVEAIEVVVAGVSRQRIMCANCAARFKQPSSNVPLQQVNTETRAGEGFSYIQKVSITTDNTTTPADLVQEHDQHKKLYTHIGTKFGITALLGLLCLILLCKFVFNLNILGEMDYAPNSECTHSWNTGICEYCSMDCIEEIGKIIMSNPDQVTADNSYVKSYLTRDLCPSVKVGTLLYDGALGIGYIPESKILVLEFAYHGGAKITQMIAINGAVAKYYTYQFRDDNRAYGGSYDYLSGQFNANTLKDTTSFSYTEVSSTAPSALKYFIEDHQKDACNFTKLLVKALNGFCEQNNLPFSAHELGFTQLTDSE